MENIWTELLKMGVMGIGLFALGYWINKKDKDHTQQIKDLHIEHAKERESWKKTSEDQFKIANDSQADTTTLLTEISTLLKTLVKRTNIKSTKKQN
mgnify:CR=1 FL=1